jgi:hypothetical protein
MHRDYELCGVIAHTRGKPAERMSKVYMKIYDEWTEYADDLIRPARDKSAVEDNFVTVGKPGEQGADVLLYVRLDR